MRRILFLDVDGVLNNLESSCAPMRSFFSVHPDCTQRLRRIVDDLDVQMVLSSTWRFAGYGREPSTARICDALADHGWIAPPFIGCTTVEELAVGEERMASGRGMQCNLWIKNHGVEGDIYVAVDDDGDFLGFNGVLVQTSFEPGLTEEKAAELRAALEAGR